MYFTHSYFKTLRNKAVQEYIENKKKTDFHFYFGFNSASRPGE